MSEQEQQGKNLTPDQPTTLDEVQKRLRKMCY